MVNRTIVSIFNEYKGFWNKYTNEYDFMYVKIPNDTKNAVRQNFGISFNEEILFVRDTSFWSSKNQGLVITDNGIYCIPDNNSPEEKIEFGWKDVSKVKFRDWVLFFYGYGNEEDYCPIHVSYFCKKEELYDKIGNKCAEMFLRIANSTQPEKDVTSQVWELIRQQKQDEALELAMRYRNIEGNEELYLCLVKLRKRSKLLRMNNDLLVEYVLGYELAIYRVFWSSAFCITSNNSFCIAKVLIFSHFTKNSQRKFPFYPHFR